MIPLVKRLWLVLALGVTLAGCGGSSTRPHENGPIAASDATGHGVVVRDPDGHLSHLTSTRDWYAIWSPDGTKIAFQRTFNADGASHVMVMNADGSGLRQLGSTPSDSSGLSWSPDGDEIAFGIGNAIAVMTPDGSGLRKLAEGGTSPAWSPDGRTIVFHKPPGLYAVNADGTGAHVLIDASSPSVGILGDPAWAPDGKRLTFTRKDLFSQTQSTKIEIANADGSGERALADVGFGQEAARPSWSPDGTTIVFYAVRNDREGLWTLPANGGMPRLLLEGRYALPNWGPART